MSRAVSSSKPRTSISGPSGQIAKGWEDMHFGHAVPTAENKRDKRRKEMVDRVERLRRETLERRELIYHDLHNQLSLSLSTVLAQPHSTNPDYLLRLHGIGMERDARLLNARMDAVYSLEAARNSYKKEVQKIQDEFESGVRGIKDKLLESCDERAKKLREDKDTSELSLDSLFDPQPRTHTTRRLRTTNGPGTRLKSSQFPAPDPTNPMAALALPEFTAVPDQNIEPLGFSILPSSPFLNTLGPLPTLLNPASNSFHSMTALAAAVPGPRGGRGRHGLPQHGVAIPPGTYNMLGRSLLALSGLRNEELNEDLEGMRRKRRRGRGQEDGPASRAAKRREAEKEQWN